MTKPIYLTFFEHLDELRKRIIISLIALLIGTLAACYYSAAALRILLQPVTSEIHEFYFFSPAAAFMVKFKIALLLGFLAASPVIISQLWLFVSPGLHGKEKKLVIPLIGVTSALFLSGAFFCFTLVIPYIFKFLVGMQTEFLKPMISIESYMNFLFGMMLAFGISFNMPVFIIAFVLVGLLSVKTLNRYQRHIVVLIFILAAVLTPTPDISGQLMLAVPLVLLFELSIVGSWIIEKLRKREKAMNER